MRDALSDRAEQWCVAHRAERYASRFTEDLAALPLAERPAVVSDVLRRCPDELSGLLADVICGVAVPMLDGVPAGPIGRLAVEERLRLADRVFAPSGGSAAVDEWIVARLASASRPLTAREIAGDQIRPQQVAWALRGLYACGYVARDIRTGHNGAIRWTVGGNT